MPQENNRLQAIVDSGNVLEFFSAADREHGQIRWTVYGAIDTNEIIVRATVAGRSFFKASESRLLFPAMIDRRFGIDVLDNHLAQELSGQLWAECGPEMLTLQPTRDDL